MTQKSHLHSGNSNDSSHHKSSHSKGQKMAPKSKLLRFLYKSFKYSTLIFAIVLVVLSGIVILGDSSLQAQTDRTIFNVYKNSDASTEIVDEVKTLLEKQSSKYVSNNAINLYVQENSENQPDLKNKFDDLLNFAEFIVSQSKQGQKILKLPLSFYNEDAQTIVPDTQTSKWLSDLKTKVRKFLEKSKLDQDEQARQLKWSRVKKMIDNAKFGQIVELVKQNIINCVWKWLHDEPNVILLFVDEHHRTSESVGNKRQLNKWVRDHSQDTLVIILSQYPINDVYDTKEEDYFKSYQVEIGVDRLEQESLCGADLKLSQVQCLILKSRFETLDELEKFLQHTKNEEEASVLKNKQDNEASRVLQNVCEKGHVKYYFYENQEQANRVLSRNKKSKKSRLDRELEALLVKWSQLKRFIGLNRIKDVWNTLRSDSQNGEKLSLWQANELGLVFDFNLHQLKWRSQQDRIRYEILNGITCKGGDQVAEELRLDEEEEEEEQRKLKESQDRQEGQQVEDEEEEQVVEQEYEENFIQYDAEEEEQQEDAQTGTVEQEREENEKEHVEEENNDSTNEEQEPEQTNTDSEQVQVQEANTQENVENEVNEQEETEEEETNQAEEGEETNGAEEEATLQEQQHDEENVEQAVDEQQEIQQSEQQQAQQEDEEKQQENDESQQNQQEAVQQQQEEENNEQSSNDQEEIPQEQENTIPQGQQEQQQEEATQDNQETQQEEQIEINEQEEVEQTGEVQQQGTQSEQQQTNQNTEDQQDQIQAEAQQQQVQEEQQQQQEQQVQEGQQATQQQQEQTVQDTEQIASQENGQTTDAPSETTQQPEEQITEPINQQSTEPESTNEPIDEQQAIQNNQENNPQQPQGNEQSQKGSKELSTQTNDQTGHEQSQAQQA